MSHAADPAPDMRQRILDVTALLLREHSYQATTMRGIAEHVGIKGGSIYHHFPSKDAIVAGVVDEGVRVVHAAVVAALAGLPDEAPPRMKLEAAIRAHLLSSLQNSAYVSASLRTFPHLPPELRDGCRAARHDYEAIWAGLLAEAPLPRGTDPEAVRLLLLGAVNWAGEWYRPGRLSIEAIARQWAGIVLP